ncbi:Alpha-soluble NSF attachment protein [Trichinella pseudospiralis]|uniref:Alpha-soluble NSF attachment protein n=1 Tax=Trichinella pseudospiralis TaxID=6337 RepID=A0A0V1FM37_TRIPS|nr:Alpha-soluble NSF attachment protein [Trichinella pseudospiralis]
MEESESKAQKIMQEAEKKSRITSGFFGLFGGSKVDEACELYVKAGNLFKIAKKWTEAGDAFVRSAKLTLSRGDYKHEAATNYVDASNCYRKINPKQAIDCLLKAVEIYSEMGRFTMAAKYYMSVAELYEVECNDPEKAMHYYEKAADYYKGEESKSSANKCMLKVAQFAAELEQYKKAADIFEEIGTSYAENTLLKYSAKDYFFKAVLCHLCRDVLDAQDALHAVEEHDAEEFTNAVKEYDKISRLDQWTTTLLLRVKKKHPFSPSSGYLQAHVWLFLILRCVVHRLLNVTQLASASELKRRKYVISVSGSRNGRQGYAKEFGKFHRFIAHCGAVICLQYECYCILL